MILSYALIYMSLVTVFFKSHMAMADAYAQNSSEARHHKKTTAIISTVIALFVTAQIVLTVLSLVKALDIVKFNVQLVICQLVITVGTIIHVIFLYIKFAGSPYKNNESKTKL